jgi:hypothetical protein
MYMIGSVADPGCLSWIPDPTFFYPGSRIRIFSIPDPHQTPKNEFLALENMIRVVHPGSRIRIRNTDDRSTYKITAHIFKAPVS